jgi:hypothetical protein
MSRLTHGTVRRLLGVLVLSVLCLALSAGAAQASPTGLVQNGHGGWKSTPAPSAPAPQVRVVTVSADNGFSWMDAALGAAVAAGVLIIGRVAVTRPSPRLSH